MASFKRNCLCAVNCWPVHPKCCRIFLPACSLGASSVLNPLSGRASSLPQSFSSAFEPPGDLYERRKSSQNYNKSVGWSSSQPAGLEEEDQLVNTNRPSGVGDRMDPLSQSVAEADNADKRRSTRPSLPLVDRRSTSKSVPFIQTMSRAASAMPLDPLPLLTEAAVETDAMTNDKFTMMDPVCDDTKDRSTNTVSISTSDKFTESDLTMKDVFTSTSFIETEVAVEALEAQVEIQNQTISELQKSSEEQERRRKSTMNRASLSAQSRKSLAAQGNSSDQAPDTDVQREEDGEEVVEEMSKTPRGSTLPVIVTGYPATLQFDLEEKECFGEEGGPCLSSCTLPYYFSCIRSTPRYKDVLPRVIRVSDLFHC